VPLNAGDLDKRVTIQSRTEADDGGGGVTIAWANVASVWASVAPGTGREFTLAQQLQPELSHVVIVRYRAGLTAKHRFVYVSKGTTRTFAIHVVSDPMERHEQLICYCSEVSPT
jgi:SPP1 family predicted phage head-tail adaptor